MAFYKLLLVAALIAAGSTTLNDEIIPEDNQFGDTLDRFNNKDTPEQFIEADQVPSSSSLLLTDKEAALQAQAAEDDLKAQAIPAAEDLFAQATAAAKDVNLRPIVSIDDQTFHGTLEFTNTSSRPSFNVEAWYDIEYASAGRFEQPEMKIQSKKTKKQRMKIQSKQDPVQPTQMCMQIAVVDPYYHGKEECLYLDVYRPADHAESDGLLPVMVYIHGGGMLVGSKQNYNFKEGLKMFVAEGVIVVSINYRLGVFGAFIDPVNPIDSGLWGLKDQIMALKWVQRHIKEFRGDKDRVTIFGQSGGGLSVTALYASPRAKKLFHGAIAQSPGWQTPSQYQVPSTDAATSIATKCVGRMKVCGIACGCWSFLVGKKCMRQAWGNSLVLQCTGYGAPPNFLAGESGVRWWNGYDGDGTNLPNDDGLTATGNKPYLKQDLYTATCKLQTPTGSDVPLLIGSNKYEWTFFNEQAKVYSKGKILDSFLRQRIKGYTAASKEKKLCVVNTLLDTYNIDDFASPWSQLLTDVVFTIGPQLLSAVHKTTNTYRYVLDTAGTGTFEGEDDSAHGDELCFFHDPLMTHWTESDDGKSFHIDGQQRNACGGQQDASTKGGKILREYWLSFAKTGVPSSATAALENIEDWTEVITSDGPENRLGLPFMQIDFSVDGFRPEKTKMTDSPWSTKESAEMLGNITCNLYDIEDELFGTEECEQKQNAAAEANYYQEEPEEWYKALSNGAWCEGGCHRRRRNVIEYAQGGLTYANGYVYHSVEAIAKVFSG